MNQPVQWGILGTARIALSSVGPGIQLASNAQLKGLAGRKPEKIEEYNRQLKAEKTFSSYDALLDDPDIEAVYIPLPNNYHKEWILKALRKGKHVLCEKPLCLTPEETKEVFDEAEKQGLFLVEAFASLHNPLVPRLKSLIAEGAIGDIKGMDSWFYFKLENPTDFRWKKDLGGGAAYDIGCYPISLMRTLVGEEPIDIESRSVLNEEGIDMRSTGSLYFPGGVEGIFHCGFDSDYTTGCTLFGTEGRIVVDQPFNQPGKQIIEVHKPGETRFIEVDSPHNYRLEVEDLSRCIREGGSPLVDRKVSEGNAAVIDSILKQAEEFSAK